jgi:hypothetical protein
MYELMLLSIGVLLMMCVDGMLKLWRQSQAMQRHINARNTLHHHGLTPRLYLATIGVDNVELRAAMDEFACSGHIILNDNGEVIGNLVATHAERPPLRLVVRNDSSECR